MCRLIKIIGSSGVVNTLLYLLTCREANHSTNTLSDKRAFQNFSKDIQRSV